MFCFVLVSMFIIGSAGDYTCYDFQFNPRVCLPGPQNIAGNHLFELDPRYTCGSPPSGYCRSAKPSGCAICNASSSVDNHPVPYLTDKDYPLNYWNFGYKPTWWQSITWWDAKERSLLINNKLKITLALSMNKSYDLTGSFQVTFYSSKPHAFVFERSSDFGETWKPFRYYADKCSFRFPNVSLISGIKSSMDVYCVEDSSLDAVQGAQVVFQPAYSPDTFWTKQVQEYVTATNFRISLEYPWTDNNENIRQESFYNKYYYDITDIQIHGRCHCNGHAPYCFHDKSNSERCYCQHNTDGVDCEKCLPLFNNKKWKAAEATDKPNPCEECNCNNHARMCTYNETLGYGMCENCQNGTSGHHCEECGYFYYRNVNVSVTHESTCLSCDCILHGVTNDGSCSKNNGQCLCKPNIHGRRCDQCKTGYYGLEVDPIGICQSCNCSVTGTLHGDITCAQKTGQCSCKNTTDGLTCSECKAGFYSFPQSTNGECLQCMCDLGGSRFEHCHEDTGSCYCRNGVYGRHCNETIPGGYFPTFDHYLLEAESSEGVYKVHSSLSGQFTGFGFAELKENGSIKFAFTPAFTSLYQIVVRYGSINTPHNLSVLLTYTNETVSFPLFSEEVVLQSNATDISLAKKFVLTESINYTVTIMNRISTHVLIDSIVIVPDFSNTKIYLKGSEREKRQLSQCWNESFSRRDQQNDDCYGVVFSSTVEMFNGTLDCDCNAIGSLNATCDEYGGQCFCKSGVMGHQCDQCRPGYFNFSENGCQQCQCNAIGSNHLVCSRATGQCECKDNVTSRVCGECVKDFYGFGSPLECRDCGCNVNGSSASQCLDDGQCVCKDSTEGAKCDACRENYFNFTVNGCSRCECDPSGSKNLQCGQLDGFCPCKSNVKDGKCSSCLTSYFNLNAGNPSGCQECFCFNKTAECQSADGQQIVDIAFDASDWLNVNNNSYLNRDNQELHFNFTSSSDSLKLSAPSGYHGNRLYIAEQSIAVRFLTINVADSGGRNYSNSSIHLNFIGGHNNKMATFAVDSIPNNVISTKEFLISARSERDRIPAWKLQDILFDVKKLELQFNGQPGGYGVLYNVQMSRLVQQSVGGQPRFDGVEQCSCSVNYTGLSCEYCAKGYTRENGTANGWDDCVLCSCNNRSSNCDGITGGCFDCRHGTEGKRCERCQPNVMEPSCQQCLPGYYGYNNNEFVGCKACDCVAPNTLNGGANVCDPHSGQCPCKVDIGGRRCDRCAENAVNISHVCTACSDCHALVQDEVHTIRSLLRNFKAVVHNTTNAAALLSNATFPQLLLNLFSSVLALLTKSNSAAMTEQRLFNDIQMLNETVDKLQAVLAVNISRDINLIRAQLPSVAAHQNRSNEILDTIYNFMWISVYVINADVQPRSEELPGKLDELGRIANNLSAIASERLSTYAPILKDLSHLLNSTSHVMVRTEALTNASTESYSVLNDTADRLTDLSRASSATNLLVNTLYDEVLRLMNSSYAMLQRINSTAEELVLISLNNTTQLLQELNSRHSAMLNETRLLNDTYKNVYQTHQSIYTSAKVFMENSTEIFKKVNSRNEIAAEVYRNVTRAKQMVDNATGIANVTYITAKQILFVLSNYQNAIANATVLINLSLNQLSSLNSTSVETIAFVEKMKNETLQLLRNSTHQLNVSQTNNQTVYILNENFSHLLKTVKELANRSVLTNYNFTALKAIFQNINSIGFYETRLEQQCKNLTNIAEAFYKQGVVALQWGNHATREQKLQGAELQRIFTGIQDMKKLNQTEITDLQNVIRSARTKFDQMSLAHALKLLRDSKTEQSQSIDEYKQQIKSLKEEINTMKLLYDSMSKATGCNDPS